jgi:hypothetical protein
MKTLAELGIKTKIREAKFSDIERDLMIRLDEFDDIKTEFVQESDRGPNAHYTFPTRCGFVRDATNAIPLANRMPPDHKDIRAANSFIRASNLVHAISHVVAQKNSQPTDALDELKTCLLDYYDNVFNHDTVPDSSSRQHFKNLEANFHTQILKILYSQNLTLDLKTPYDYADLLEHYRNLASLLAPAASYITTQKYGSDKDAVFFKDIAHPVTRKTDLQKTQISVMRKVGDGTANFHSSQPRAFQEASAAFVDLLLRDDTALGAQTRGTNAATAKNAFTVTNELVFASGTSQWHALRTASLGYIGKGETPESCAAYAVENIKQLQQANDKTNGKQHLFITLLVTNHFFNKQSTIVAISRDAAAQTGANVSVMPINLIGASYPLELSPELQTLATQLNKPLPVDKGGYTNMLYRKLRTENAVAIINTIAGDQNSVPVVGCASGQDRTGTALEIATIKWTVAEFAKHNIVVSEKQVAEFRATGGHNAMMATLTVPGAPGMKTDSDPGYFSALVARFLYRESSNYNKSPSIDYASTAKIIGTMQPFSKEDLRKNYEENTSKIYNADNADDVINALINYAEAALYYQINKNSDGVYGYLSSMFRYIKKGTWNEGGLALREVTVGIALGLANAKSSHSKTSVNALLKEVNLLIERTSTVYPPAQRGFVFNSLEKIVSLSEQKLKKLGYEAVKHTTQPEFKA